MKKKNCFSDSSDDDSELFKPKSSNNNMQLRIDKKGIIYFKVLE